MRRRVRIVLMAGLVALAPVLAGCENFDLDKLDVFDLNEKKKLPGERHPVFPGGVPGVTQGIPPEYLKDNQQPPATADVLPPAQGNPQAAVPPNAAARSRAGPLPSNRCKPRRSRKPSQSRSPNTSPKPRQSRKPNHNRQPRQQLRRRTNRNSRAAPMAGDSRGAAAAGAILAVEYRANHNGAVAVGAAARHLLALTPRPG